MPTLNRFPLLGLWAREAARRLGYRKTEAEALGHAYAVLYAIRAQGHKKTRQAKPSTAAPAETSPEEEIEFCGDNLPIQRDANQRLQGLVGHDDPQTARTYHAHIMRKFPPGYYEKLEDAFRAVLKAIPPRELRADHRLYQLYDQWKRSCGVGRLVDLDRLLQWCQERGGEPRTK